MVHSDGMDSIKIRVLGKNGWTLFICARAPVCGIGIITSKNAKWHSYIGDCMSVVKMELTKLVYLPGCTAVSDIVLQFHS